MKKIVVIAIALVILGGGAMLLIRSRLNPAKGEAILKVSSNPATTIFLDNQNIGKTPFEDKVAAGEYTLKLIPESTVDTAVSWEGKVTLSPNLLTFVNRDLGSSDLTTGGEILTLEKINSKKAELAVTSTPDGAVVTLGNDEKGKTPLVVEDVEPGNYDLTLTSSGFGTRTVKIKTTQGYKLTTAFQLAATGELAASPSPTPEGSPTASPKSSPKATPKSSPKASGEASASASPKSKASPPAKPYVEILDTPTGFLRVRANPSTSGEEVGRVDPGEFYSLLDEDNGWYKIEYEKDKEGWISGQYAEKFE